MPMNIDRGLDILKDSLGEIPELRTKRPDSERFRLWKDKVKDVVEVVWGRDSTEYERVRDAGGLGMQVLNRRSLANYEALKKKYLRSLTKYERAIKSIVQKNEGLGISKPAPEVQASTEALSVFIAHGGRPPALTKLQEFLIAIGATPIVAEDEPTEARSVNEQVEWCMDRAQCAIVLATAEDLETGKLYSRPNVHIEVGRFQERFPNKTIYLLEEGAKLPSNVEEKVWERFTQECMERAFLKVAKELRALGFLKAEAQ